MNLLERDDRVALLVIDMVKDYFDPDHRLPITGPAMKIIEPINNLARAVRAAGGLVVFATDSFRQEDFIFTGRLQPHAIVGTRGAEVIDELERRPEDIWLPKPRFSAFFGTDLAGRLKKNKISVCAVAGIATHICVLTSALDAVCNDFKAILVEDCTAAYPEFIHTNTLDNYRRNPLQPLLEVAISDDLVADLDQIGASSA